MKFFRNAMCVLVLWVGAQVSAAELNWLTDLDAAKAVAAQQKKQLLVDFTGSTWCPPCIALHDEVLTGKKFAAFAKDYVLVKLDYPRAKDRTPEKVAADPALRKLMDIKNRHGISGYPTLIFLDAEGEEYGRVLGYSKGSGEDAFLKQLAAAKQG